MGTYEWLLVFHLLGALLFVSGAVVAAVLQLAAMRRDRPAEIAVLLGAIRAGVLLVAAGSVLVLVFGIWLAEHVGYGLGEGWVSLALGLFVLAVALGGIAGRHDKATRKLAVQLAEDGDRPSPELHRRLRDPVPLALNYGSGALVLAILVVMVWKPAL